MSNREYIKELCIGYVGLVVEGVDYYRLKVHQELVYRTKLPEDKINEIFHNLDQYIGLPVPVPFQPAPPPLRHGEIKKYGIKLFSLLERMMIDQVSRRLKSDGDAVEFFKTNGIEIEEWIDMWKENMELDEEGNPILEKCIKIP